MGEMSPWPCTLIKLSHHASLSWSPASCQISPHARQQQHALWSTSFRRGLRKAECVGRAGGERKQSGAGTPHRPTDSALIISRLSDTAVQLNTMLRFTLYDQNVKIFRALILGELERGQNQYQALCFLSRLNHNEIIPSESMARLRQKNPLAIRLAEERRGLEQLTMSTAVNLSRAGQLSSHVYNVCSEAREAIYTSQEDAKHWLDKGAEGSVFEILPQTADVPGLQPCRVTTDLWQPCLCVYSLRLEWYPCLLKFCRSRETTGKGAPYRCGIKSCSKGYQFTYYVPQKQLCLWDEET
ncbi:unnamed protein product [Boreogadus saida]